jgi:hypothetical protein
LGFDAEIQIEDVELKGAKNPGDRCANPGVSGIRLNVDAATKR